MTTPSDTPAATITFADFGLDPLIQKAVSEQGYTIPTPIQAQSIPHVLAGSDLMGAAQTGTGKTAAFGLPILQKINPKSTHIQALILSPTRELGQQIAKQLFKFTKYTDSSSGSYGNYYVVWLY